MATPRKAGGYIDQQELNRALRANRQARQVLSRILAMCEQRPGAGWLYPLLAELAQAHSIILEALMEMERIRVAESSSK